MEQERYRARPSIKKIFAHFVCVVYKARMGINRRGFLKASVAVSVASAFPAVAEVRRVLDVEAIVGFTQKIVQKGVGSGWFAIVHPAVEKDIRDMAARDRWKGAFVDWRKDGKPELNCQQILDKYLPIHDCDVGPIDEIGSYENVRFIISDRVFA